MKEQISLMRLNLKVNSSFHVSIEQLTIGVLKENYMLYFKSARIIFLLVMFTFCIFFSIRCIAQVKTGTLSGTVIDKNGEPIEGFMINLSPSFVFSKTDENGVFSFTNISHGPVLIGIPVQQSENEKGEHKVNVGMFEPDYEVVSVKIGNITIFQDRHPPFGGVKFGVKPGTHIRDVVVIAQPRMRIRTRVVAKDGTPFPNVSISTNVQHESVDKESSGRSSSGTTTDSEGYFLHYIQKDNVPAHYIVSVKYKGMSAKSEEILIEEGTRYDLVLTLDGDVPVTKPTTTKSPRSSLPNILRKLSKKPKQTDKSNVGKLSTNTPKQNETLNIDQPSKIPKQIERSDEAIPNSTPQSNVRKLTRDGNTWIVNPANGHGYKKIWCGSLNDAQKQARANGAYLVAINDEVEQKWLSGVFGNHLYWIGLSDSKTEGQWVWQDGEPLTYTNWGSKHRFPRSTLSAERQDAAVMTFINGIWHAVGRGDLFWRVTKQAILEKGE